MAATFAAAAFAAAAFAATALLLLHLLLLLLAGLCVSADAAFAAAALPFSFCCCSCSSSLLCFFFQINCVDQMQASVCHLRAANKGSKEGSNKKLLPFLSSSRLPAVQNELFGLLRRLGAAQCIY